ncbi:MAG: CopG family transcriptional regulator [Okeania sp. SIO2C2]|nr:CopG family transcriptional regulator [Okeania sp. SIO2C2]
MPAPIGNRNAESVWFTPVDPKESTVYISGRILESQQKAVDEIIKKEGMTKSALIREAVGLWLRQYQEERAGSSAVG